MAKPLTRSRPTRWLIEAALDRFYGCAARWRSDALDYIDDVLAPLRLRDREMRRLDRALTCPHCESRVRSGTFVVAASQDQIRQLTQSRKFDKLHRREIEVFRSFLIQYPMLGAHRRFGELLRKIMKCAKKTALEPRSWYYATTTLEGPILRPSDSASEVGGARNS